MDLTPNIQIEMENEIDHKYTREITCPHCGRSCRDSWELPDSGELDCDACDKLFFYERNVTVDYSTSKM